MHSSLASTKNTGQRHADLHNPSSEAGIGWARVLSQATRREEVGTAPLGQGTEDLIHSTVTGLGIWLSM